MQAIVKSKLVLNGEGINDTVAATLSPRESTRNQSMSSQLRGQARAQNDKRTRVVLPYDTKDAMMARSLEWRRQLAQPWGNVFMQTNTDGRRLNNMGQTAYIAQRRLTIPNSYGQFYAFMHALSAAFGQLG
jgi:hypothetical protein